MKRFYLAEDTATLPEAAVVPEPTPAIEPEITELAPGITTVKTVTETVATGKTFLYFLMGAAALITLPSIMRSVKRITR